MKVRYIVEYITEDGRLKNVLVEATTSQDAASLVSEVVTNVTRI